VKLSSSTLRKAAELQERIEQLQHELDSLLETGDESVTPAAESSAQSRDGGRERVRRPAKQQSEPKSRGRRSASPGGPLAPAVVKVLKSKNSPMSVSEILDGLTANGYKFASPEPKKNLFARIYRLKGVKQVGPGKFSAE